MVLPGKPICIGKVLKLETKTKSSKSLGVTFEYSHKFPLVCLAWGSTKRRIRQHPKLLFEDDVLFNFLRLDTGSRCGLYEVEEKCVVLREVVSPDPKLLVNR